jgi:hypothetical protein
MINIIVLYQKRPNFTATHLFREVNTDDSSPVVRFRPLDRIVNDFVDGSQTCIVHSFRFDLPGRRSIEFIALSLPTRRHQKDACWFG